MSAPKYLINTFIAIGVILVVVIAVGAMLLFKPSENAPQHVPEVVPPVLEPITFEGEWIPAEFPPGYPHSYTLQLPSTWELAPGEDTDGWRASGIFPPSGDGRVFAVDFLLIGCPDGGDDCTLEETVPISAEEFMRRQVAFLDTVDLLESTGSLTLPNVETPVLTYRSTPDSGESRDLSFFQFPNSVVLIEFQPSELFPSALKMQLLESVQESGESGGISSPQ